MPRHADTTGDELLRDLLADAFRPYVTSSTQLPTETALRYGARDALRALDKLATIEAPTLRDADSCTCPPTWDCPEDTSCPVCYLLPPSTCAKAGTQP